MEIISLPHSHIRKHKSPPPSPLPLCVCAHKLINKLLAWIFRWQLNSFVSHIVYQNHNAHFNTYLIWSCNSENTAHHLIKSRLLKSKIFERICFFFLKFCRILFLSLNTSKKKFHINKYEKVKRERKIMFVWISDFINKNVILRELIIFFKKKISSVQFAGSPPKCILLKMVRRWYSAVLVIDRSIYLFFIYFMILLFV